jgi:hypothetical protein
LPSKAGRRQGIAELFRLSTNEAWRKKTKLGEVKEVMRLLLGIGEQIVHQLAPANTLIVLARSAEKLALLEQTYRSVSTHAIDLAKTTEVSAACTAISQTYACIDLLINNAATQYTRRSGLITYSA